MALRCGLTATGGANELSATTMNQLTKTAFGTLPTGEEINLFTLTNSNGLEVSIMNYGGRIVTLKTPDREGKFDDLVLGFDTLDGYIHKNPYFGALVGRYANRIAGASFVLDGKTFSVPMNDGPNSLHGGTKGFDKVVWTAREVHDGENAHLELSHRSPDGENGYPGTLDVQVSYELTDENELRIGYRAGTDKKTVINLTNHSYFDLSGQGERNVLDHVVTVNADYFTPINQHLIPTGEFQGVEDTPFDFRSPTVVGARIDDKNEQLKLALGYDHNFVLNRALLNGSGGDLTFAARALHPKTGRVLEVSTTQPGIQFYTGNHLDGSVKGKGDATYPFRSGLCFETQHFPDSPNQPNFPSTELNPQEEYQSSTVFRFSVDQ